jgi:integrase
LQSCRLGHNLRFSSADSEVVTLGFQAYETKNWNEIEFYVGPRLCSLLKTYIEHFLPFFASASPDFSDSKWLFPAGDGKEGPLSVNQVRKVITDTVAERVGAIFHPHLFRALAVRLCLEHSPGALEHCRQLLGDKSLEVILAYYAPIRRKEASEYIDRLVDAEEDRLVALDRHATARRRRRNLQP